MIDIYHFSKPLSTHCLTTEQCLTNITSDIAQHAHLHFVPLINMDFIANLENHALNPSKIIVFPIVPTYFLMLF